MQLFHLLPLLLILQLANCCLKVQLLSLTTTPEATLAPGCGCEALALNRSTIRNYISQDNPFYPLLTIATLEAPILELDECNGRLLCAQDYSLVLFDGTDLGKNFGAYAAEGFCDTSDRTWQVATRDSGLTKFEQLYGICFTTAMTTATTKISILTTTVPSTSSSAPNTLASTKSSSTTSTSHSSIDESTPTPTTISQTTSTSPTSATTITTNTSNTGYLSTFPACSCQFELLDGTSVKNYIDYENPFFDLLMSEHIVAPTRSEEPCIIEITCPEDYSLLVFDRKNLGKTFDQSASGACDPLTQKWKVDTGSRVRLTTFNQMLAVCIPHGSKTLMLNLKLLLQNLPNRLLIQQPHPRVSKTSRVLQEI